MDQHAFRQLISTPRNIASQQSSPPSSSPRYFGKQNKRVVKEDRLHASALLPRKVEGTSKKASASTIKEKSVAVNSSTGETYVDRAEVRRLGIEESNEYIEAKALRRDLEQRILQAQDEEEKEKLKNQMDYLGGDAKHSGMVKGLDYALLAQQKAKLSHSANGSGSGNEGMDNDEDNLEDAYGLGQGREAEKHKDNSSKAVLSKFKPIGASTGFKSVEIEEDGAPEYIWRNGKRMRKKKKKKIEAALASDSHDSLKRDFPSPTMSSAKESTQSPVRNVNDGIDKNKKAIEVKQTKRLKRLDQERADMPPPPMIPLLKAKGVASNVDDLQPTEIDKLHAEEHHGNDLNTDDANESDDEGADIFADAGRWNGLDDSEDDEDNEVETGEKTITTTILELPPSGKRDWFSTGKEAVEEKIEKGKEFVPLPSDLNTILQTVNEAKKSHVAKEKSKTSNIDEKEEEEEEDDDEDEDEDEKEDHRGQQVATQSTRLEGFSDSILGREGVRYMLEKKDDEGSRQKRKRKRSKKGKGGYGSD